MNSAVTKLLLKTTPLVLVLLLFGCQQQSNKTIDPTPPRFVSASDMIEWIRKPTKDYVMVVAHRGYWRSAPENSLLAVENAVKAGIEIVEIDVKKTSDNHLVIIHDKTLDRTTTGKGKIEDITLDSVKSVFLKTGVGIATHYKVPTLREMMEFVSTQRLLVNLDKCWDYLPEAYQVLKETNTVNQVLFKGSDPLDKLREKHGALLDSIHYMPMVWPENYNIYTNDVSEEPISYVDQFLSEFNPMGFEVIYDAEDSPVIATIEHMQSEGVAVWVNTLWPELCGGHYDELAYKAPDKHWGWVVDHGANIVQSDRPTSLIKYLRSQGLHD